MNKILVLGIAVLLTAMPLQKKDIKYVNWKDFKAKSINALFIRENIREKRNIANNKRDGEIVPSTWNIGDNGKWVAYDSNSKLVKGLIYDKSRDKYFLMNLSNGDMVYENGLYLIKNKIVHLTFSNIRVGEYGSLDSGVERLKSVLK